MTEIKNEIDLTDTTVKLVSTPSNQRAGLFESLLNLRPVYTLLGRVNNQIDPDAYYHIFFNFDTFPKKEDLIMKMAELQEDNIITVLDISDNSLFLKEDTSSVTSVAAIFASFVTCSSAEIQGQVYEHTGRESIIVEQPLFTQDFIKPLIESKEEKDVKVLWYGLSAEIFSIRPYMQSTNFPIATYMEAKDTRNWKQWKLELNKADIVFLPKTFTQEDEETRLLKAEECVKLGKFVVAPALDSNTICMDCDLKDGISLIVKNSSKVEKIVKENQKALKRLYDPQTSADQLMQALRMAPNDEFAQNLDYALHLVEGN